MYLEMDVQFQKSIFGNLVPNGPYIEVLPKFFATLFARMHYSYMNCSYMSFKFTLLRKFFATLAARMFDFFMNHLW